MIPENTCCKKHFAWSVLGTPPLAKHERRCEDENQNRSTGSAAAITAAVMAPVGSPAKVVSDGQSETFSEPKQVGIAQSAADILDILCEPSLNQDFYKQLKQAA